MTFSDLLNQAAGDTTNSAIARATDCKPHTVGKWRARAAVRSLPSRSKVRKVCEYLGMDFEATCKVVESEVAANAIAAWRQT